MISRLSVDASHLLKKLRIFIVTHVTDLLAWRDSKLIPPLLSLRKSAKLRHRFHLTANHPLRLVVLDTTQQEAIFFVIQRIHYEKVHLAEMSVAHTSSRMPRIRSLGDKISIWFEKVFEATDTISGCFLVVARLYSANEIGWFDAGDGVESDVEARCWFLF
jgi:hypothetical protein